MPSLPRASREAQLQMISYQANLHSWIIQDEPNVEYLIWCGTDFWVIEIQFGYFDAFVFLDIDTDGRITDYLRAIYD